MLLTKLKITFCAAGLMLLAGIGATSLTYRVTAQEPRQGVAQASRTQSDELEALRLEIEALRKSLQVTRESVKALQLEVNLLKRQPADSMRRDTGQPERKPADPAPQKKGQRGFNPFEGKPKAPAEDEVPSKNNISNADELRTYRDQIRKEYVRSKEAVDPLAQAEAALAKLRKNPGDKEAAEALERALQRLKERAQPRSKEARP